MRNEEDIFRDGELVETIIMPLDVVKGGPSVKRQWAKEVFGDYVFHFHGVNARNHVIEHVTSAGRVTGTQATFLKGNEKIVFMLVEPKDQPDSKGEYRIHVIKAVYNLNTGINQSFFGSPLKNTAMADAFAKLGK